MERYYFGLPGSEIVDITDPVNFLSSIHHGNPDYVYTVAEMAVLVKYLHWGNHFTLHTVSDDPITVSQWLRHIRTHRAKFALGDPFITQPVGY